MRSRWAMEIYRARQRAAPRRPGSAIRQGQLPGLLLIIFVVLKLTGVVSWSWWWVLSPLWISGILLVLALCAGVFLLRRHARRRMRAWKDHFVSGQWWRETPVAPRADNRGGDPGPGDGEGPAG